MAGRGRTGDIIPRRIWAASRRMQCAPWEKQEFVNEEPLGKRLSIGGPPAPGKQPDWMTIVGVVAHVKNYGVDQASRFETYIPQAQRPAGGGTIVVRSSGNPAALTSGIRAAVRSLSPDVPLSDVRSMQEI